MAHMTTDDLLNMAVQLETYGPAEVLSETDIRAILFGTRSARDRQGLGACGPRRTGLNAGEQKSVIADLVALGLLEEHQNGARTVYSLA